MNKYLKEVIRQMSYGSLEQAMKLLEVSNGSMVLNAAFIERFNGIMRERLASFKLKYRKASEKLLAFHTGMCPIGRTYIFVSLIKNLVKALRKED